MKLNSNTTPNGKNKIDAKTMLNHVQSEAWALTCLSGLGKDAAFNEVADIISIAHLLETIEKRLESLCELIDLNNIQTVTPTPAGTESQALLTLLLVMLKQWRAKEISGNEFEAALKQAVSLASSLVEGKA